jgi:hypothetical protein
VREFSSSLLWLLIALAALLPLQDWVSRRLSGILVRLSRDQRRALNLYAALFFPGILLHEGSHWLTALLLGARPKAFSLRPVLLRDGSYRLGYVGTPPVDIFRGALIGGAPLASGTAALLFIGFAVLHLDDVAWAVQTQAWPTAAEWLRQTLYAPAALLWIYLAVAVGQTMLPSRADRRAWLPVALLGGAGIALALWAGVGPLLAERLLPPVAAALRTLASALTLTIALDLGLAPILIVAGRAARVLPSPRSRS